MKNMLIWAGAVALAAIVTAQEEPPTTGVILITTRAPQDSAAGTEYYTDEKGPGMATPGDVAMATLLADYGYSPRLVLDKILGDTASDWGCPPTTRDTFLMPLVPEFGVKLTIMSGSGASADTPAPAADLGIPVMMGEHVCLGDNTARPGSVFMYKNHSASSDPNQGSTPAATKYMKVLQPEHPIMKGIPLDAQGRVKIFRDRYPTENAHMPTGGKDNYEYRWCTQLAADAAPAVTVLGVLDTDETRACFAVADVDKELAPNPDTGVAEVNTVRRVHLFMNEQGSGGPRRVFLALTDLGRVLFVRAAQWAMGEELEPYEPLGVTDVTVINPGKISLSWTGSDQKNYKIVGTTNPLGGRDFTNWQTIVEDIAGANGPITRTLDIAAGPRAAYLRIASVP